MCLSDNLLYRSSKKERLDNRSECESCLCHTEPELSASYYCGNIRRTDWAFGLKAKRQTVNGDVSWYRDRDFVFVHQVRWGRKTKGWQWRLLWKKQQVMIKTSKRLIEFMLPRYTNMERAEGGKHRPGKYLTCQEKKIKTLPLGFKLRKMVKKNAYQVREELQMVRV